eukprot:Amastigsp_a676905_368.p2 type:complete len:306 gc:universal Amastigsp_a676905_368:1159-2076(+)
MEVRVRAHATASEELEGDCADGDVVHVGVDEREPNVDEARLSVDELVSHERVDVRNGPLTVCRVEKLDEAAAGVEALLDEERLLAGRRRVLEAVSGPERGLRLIGLGERGDAVVDAGGELVPQVAGAGARAQLSNSYRADAPEVHQNRTRLVGRGFRVAARVLVLDNVGNKVVANVHPHHPFLGDELQRRVRTKNCVLTQREFVAQHRCELVAVERRARVVDDDDERNHVAEIHNVVEQRPFVLEHENETAAAHPDVIEVRRFELRAPCLGWRSRVHMLQLCLVGRRFDRVLRIVRHVPNKLRNE